MKSILFTITFFFIFNLSSFCQEYFTTKKEVIEANKVIFYGYDYSKFKINDPKRMGQDIRSHIFVWTGICLSDLPDKKMAKWIDKDSVVYNLDPTLSINKSLRSDDLTTIGKYTLDKDSIQSMINKYQLSETSGIGFVITLECFDNTTKRTSAYFTFFDIATKKIIVSDYVSSHSGNSYNRVSDWGEAVVIAVKRYIPVYIKMRDSIYP